ncbi:LysR family transcriptional regulator [Vibrio splendidus]|uniref:LysR family transcriptional regulator n=1 Tax=Vibrio splendidus TaxID=29497 RepID=UPI000C828CC2|nr:LysR family transcriptional regulator [Vibrio splendidus]PMG35874.1 LysR family transcriptional regulator [Vibrio splendidus]
MKLNNVDLNLLKVFVVVYQEKSLRKAAEKLFVSTPAVSQSIKKLKESLSEELFVLSNKQFLPTPYSEDLYRRVFPLLDGLVAAIEEGKQFTPAELSEDFKIEANPHILPWLTPALFHQLAMESPLSRLISHTSSQNSLERLKNDEVDFVIHFEAESLPAEIIAVPLVTLKFVLAVRADHPFKASIATIDDLLPFPFAHVDLAYFDQNKHSRLEEEVLSQGKTINMALRTTSIIALIETIKHSNIIAPCMPPVIEQHKGVLRSIVIEGLEEGTEEMEVFAYLHKKNQYSAKYKWLLDLIETAMTEAKHQ